MSSAPEPHDPSLPVDGGRDGIRSAASPDSTTSPAAPRPATTSPEPPAPGRSDSKRSSTQSEALPGNPVGWSGLLVAVIVTAIQGWFQYNAPGIGSSTSNPLNSVLLFLSLIGGVAAVVLAIVALASRRAPVWPGWIALGVGLNVFVVSVAAWLGSVAAAS